MTQQRALRVLAVYCLLFLYHSNSGEKTEANTAAFYLGQNHFNSKHNLTKALPQKAESVAYFPGNDLLFGEECCLNNNIMKIVGNIHSGCSEAREGLDVVVLPKELDEGGAFREGGKYQLFSQDAFADLIKTGSRLGCTIVDRKMAIESKLLRRTSTNIGLKDRGPYLHWFYRNMQLFPPLQQAFVQCYPGLVKRSYLAIHLRIEEDWAIYCQERDNKPDPGKSCMTTSDIADALLTLRNENTTEIIVLISGPLSHRHALGSGNHPVEIFRKKFPLALIINRDQSGSDCQNLMGSLTYNSKALLDAWAVIHAKTFVGTLASTFSNGMTQARSLRGNEENYLYSCPRIAPIIQRKDQGVLGNGTDGAACMYAAGAFFDGSFL